MCFLIIYFHGPPQTRHLYNCLRDYTNKNGKHKLTPSLFFMNTVFHPSVNESWGLELSVCVLHKMMTAKKQITITKLPNCAFNFSYVIILPTRKVQRYTKWQLQWNDQVERSSTKYQRYEPHILASGRLLMDSPENGINLRKSMNPTAVLIKPPATYGDKINTAFLEQVSS